MLESTTSLAQDWVAYFQSNANRAGRLPFLAPRESALSLAQEAALVRTLQRFNLGESGEGSYLKRFAARTGDAAYREAIDLFIAEEQAHSHWFGLLLKRFDAATLNSHWSDALFTRARRLGGLHVELVTFLAAEIVGQKFFGLMAKACADTVVATVFGQVVRDESAHIAFHIGTLGRAFAGHSAARRWRWFWSWKLLLAVAIAIVCWDQKAVFREFDLSRRDFSRSCLLTFELVTQRIWTGRPIGPIIRRRR